MLLTLMNYPLAISQVQEAIGKENQAFRCRGGSKGRSRLGGWGQ